MPKADTEAERKVLSDVGTHGWHVVNVLEDDRGPAFSYTVGLFHSFRHPEVLVIGLPRETAHPILNEVGAAAQAGRRVEAGATYDDFLEGYDCTFRVIPPARYRFYLGWAMWFYDYAPFPALQLIYPDRERRWPWQEEASAEFRAQQPVIADEGDPPWAGLAPLSKRDDG